MNTTSPLRPRWLPSWLAALALVLAVAGARAGEVIPPPPDHRYFNDYAHVASAATASRLNSELEDLERQSSNQILVAIYPTMQSESSVEDYGTRVAASWHVGQKDKDNGAVLFVFVQEHKDYIAVRPGLEGPLPDGRCKDILIDLVRPKLQAGDYDGGLTAGVEAMIQATKGEYKGTGRTADEGKGSSTGFSALTIVVIVIFVILFFLFPNFFGLLFNILSLFSGGSGTSFGSSSGGRGGGWSSGGGSSSGGGGGASGDW